MATTMSYYPSHTQHLSNSHSSHSSSTPNLHHPIINGSSGRNGSYGNDGSDQATTSMSSTSATAPPQWKSHCVNRTNELLSCARTALKIGQQQHKQHKLRLERGERGQHSGGSEFPGWLAEFDPKDLRLYRPPPLHSLHSLHSLHTLHSGETGESGESTNSASTSGLVGEALALLSMLDELLKDLHSLVRRRGHTNDPTIEIQQILEKFNDIGRELKEGISSLRLAGTQPCPVDSHTPSDKPSFRKSSTQRRKHYELLSDQLEMRAKERMDQLKKELETRAEVLRSQNQHRKKLLGTSGMGGRGGRGGVSGVGGVGGVGSRGGSAASRPNVPLRLPTQNKSTASKASSQFQSPLFTMTSSSASTSAPPSLNASRPAAPSTSTASTAFTGNTATAVSTASTAAPSAYSGYAGYGGTSAPPPSFSTGMRQRKQQTKSHIQVDNGHSGYDSNDKYGKSTGGGYNGGNGDDNDNHNEPTIQQQIHLRRQNRETQSRLHSARLAEKSIAELIPMFSKMSTLISQQSEMLERIEDDVEMAGGEVDAGHEEIVKLYGMTRGNRGLILKVFGILIFLIVFMKLY